MIGGEPTLDDVRTLFPHWEIWTGISGLVYARRLRSSPPMVVRAEDPRDLIDAIRAEIGRRS
jgi:hypothetical protein